MRSSTFGLYNRAMTLLEVIVTLVIVLILASIAAVGYRSVIERGDDESARNAARSVLVNQMQYSRDNGVFAGTQGELGGSSSDLTFADVATDQGEISMAVGEDNSLAITTFLDIDSCFSIYVPNPRSSATEGDHGGLCDALGALGAGVAP